MPVHSGAVNYDQPWIFGSIKNSYVEILTQRRWYEEVRSFGGHEDRAFRIGIGALIKEIWESSQSPFTMWSQHVEDIPQWRGGPLLNFPIIRNVRSKFLSFISHLSIAFYHCSPNGLRLLLLWEGSLILSSWTLSNYKFTVCT
jgi:hypothetical protein